LWDQEIDRCPRSYLTEDVMEVIGWYNDWKLFGCFPYPGDALDQPLRVYEGLVLCSQVFARAERDRVPERREEADDV